MKEEPEGMNESGVRHALEAWGIEARSLAYVPLGLGDYHWTAGGPRGERFFVTVADLENKDHCGTDADTAWQGLYRAMDTASWLAERGGLDFVVAPLRAAHGETVRRLDDRYAISVFPHVEGAPGHVGEELTASRRAMTVEALAALHRAKAPDPAPVAPLDLSARNRLEQTLREVAEPWSGGPFAEPARDLLAGAGRRFRLRLDEFDRRIAEGRGNGGELVVTHGEPHPGNLLWRDGGPALVDWDTVGLSVPERDLWLVVREPGELSRYEDLTGRTPDKSALAFYRLRRDLEDVTACLGLFRGPHTRTSDTEQAWQGFRSTLERLTYL
ncbi:phosphotransferase enzyme family protein [Streptomyces sp. NPDC051018]|uniref:phosphotransferase enzyme family protein n=1 Tax=Streptomyces sp. NPDC051018 TaxID=3365639 RepID=UPI0037A9F301